MSKSNEKCWRGAQVHPSASLKLKIFFDYRFHYIRFNESSMVVQWLALLPHSPVYTLHTCMPLNTLIISLSHLFLLCHPIYKTLHVLTRIDEIKNIGDASTITMIVTS